MVEALIGPSGKLLQLRETLKIILQMHGNIPSMFDYWADLVVHPLLLKNSTSKHYKATALELKVCA